MSILATLKEHVKRMWNELMRIGMFPMTGPRDILMNLLLQYKAGKFLATWVTNSFARTLLRGFSVYIYMYTTDPKVSFTLLCPGLGV
jgi:hypothetical protein